MKKDGYIRMMTSLLLISLIFLLVAPACLEPGDLNSFVVASEGYKSTGADNFGKIVFSAIPKPVPPYTQNDQIYVMDFNGSNIVRLTHNSFWDLDPAWSPDGTKIAFCSSRDGNREIYVMDADGSNQINLTHHPSSDSDPAWSPDGTKIAFCSSRDRKSEIYVMDADGSNQINLTRNSLWDSDPAWSPDGTKIAFCSSRDGKSEIYVMDADGSNQINLTHHPSSDSDPAWSPDGTKIAFTSDRNGYVEIYIMESDGRNQKRQTVNCSSCGYPTWSPSGKRIAFTSISYSKRGVFVMEIDGKNQINFIQIHVSYGSLSWCCHNISPHVLKVKADALLEEGIKLTEIGDSIAIQKFEIAEEIYNSLKMYKEAELCKDYQETSKAEYFLKIGIEKDNAEFVLKALFIFLETKNEEGETRCKQTLAKIYLDEGKKLINEKKYQDARRKFEESMKFYVELEDTTGEELCSSLIKEIDIILESLPPHTPQPIVTVNDSNVIYGGILVVLSIGILIYRIKRRKPKNLRELEQMIKSLDEMIEKGLITEKEYEIAKKELQEQFKKL